jgi:hypothetical protein
MGGFLFWCCVSCSRGIWVEVGAKIANFQKFEEMWEKLVGLQAGFFFFLFNHVCSFF